MIDLLDSTLWQSSSATYSLTIAGFSPVEMVLWGLVLFSGFTGAVCGLYLLYVDSLVVHHTAFFKIISAGLLLFVLTAPIVFFLSVELIHAVHGFTAFVISVGLYTILRDDLSSRDGS